MKQRLSGIALSVVEIVAGALLLINPSAFTTAIITVAGVAVIVFGATLLVGYFRSDPVGSILGQGMTAGLIAIAIGVFILIKSAWIVGVFDVIVGLAILLLGVSKLGMTIDLIRMKHSGWKFSAVNAAVTLICAFVVISISAADILWIFIGIALIVQGALDIISSLLPNKKKSDVIPIEEIDSEEE